MKNQTMDSPINTGLSGQIKREYKIVAGVILISFLGFEIMKSSQMGYKFIEILLVFGTIFFGYRISANAGAICGLAAGIVLSLWDGDVAQLAIFCSIGVLAALFKSLGRIFCIIGVIFGAIGIGIVFNSSAFMSTLMALMVASAVFLVMPKFLVEPVEKKKRVFRSMRMDEADDILGERLLNISDSLSELSKDFEDMSGISLKSESGLESTVSLPELEWKNRYLESRMVVSDQFLELSNFMKSFKDELGKTVDVTIEDEKNIRKALKKKGVNTNNIVIIEGKNRRQEAVLSVYTKNRKCVSTRDIAAIFNKVTDRRWRPALDTREIVSSDVSSIRIEEETSFTMLSGVARAVKEGKEVSGDSFSIMRLPKGKIVMSLCDGMGSGRQAFAESERAINLVEKLLAAGFLPRTAVHLVHTALFLQGEAKHPLTMDLMVMDLYTGICDFIKSGAAATFIKHGKQVKIIKSETLPIGVIRDTEPLENIYKMRDSDIIVMVSDGVLEALKGDDKEEMLQRYFLTLDKTNAKDLANEILNYAIESAGGVANDDMTVLVAGIWKKYLIK